MFLAVYDPEWLQAAHPRCLWDGHETPPGERFCSEACAEHYAEWVDRVARLPIGRQPARVDLADFAPANEGDDEAEDEPDVTNAAG